MNFGKTYKIPSFEAADATELAKDDVGFGWQHWKRKGIPRGSIWFGIICCIFKDILPLKTDVSSLSSCLRPFCAKYEDFSLSKLRNLLLVLGIHIWSLDAYICSTSIHPFIFFL